MRNAAHNVVHYSHRYISIVAALVSLRPKQGNCVLSVAAVRRRKFQALNTDGRMDRLYLAGTAVHQWREVQSRVLPVSDNGRTTDELLFIIIIIIIII
jgi:hypothetical protein